VSSYLAFSPLPALCCQRTGGVFSVTLSVNAHFRERRPHILCGMPPYGVRTFLQQILRFTSDHLPSADNLAQKTEIWKSRNQDKAQVRTKIPGFLVSRLPVARLRMAMEL
jgi:hypothetical protein